MTNPVIEQTHKDGQQHAYWTVLMKLAEQEDIRDWVREQLDALPFVADATKEYNTSERTISL